MIDNTIPAITAKEAMVIKNNITPSYPLCGSASCNEPVAMSNNAAPIFVPDLIKPIPVPIRDMGRITGTDETSPTGPSDRLTLNNSIPRIGGAIVYSNNNIDNNMANPLPTTIVKVNLLYYAFHEGGTYSSMYVFQIDPHKHPRKALIQQVILEQH